MKSYLSPKLCMDCQRPGNETFFAPRLAPKSCIHAYYKLEEIVNIPHVLEAGQRHKNFNHNRGDIWSKANNFYDTHLVVIVWL